MLDRLSPLDASFLYLEEPTTAMHVGSVMVFESPPGGMDFARLRGFIGSRIGKVPRYRQRVRDVPARIAGPVWVDDVDFDLGYHVRRSALPRPGSVDQLQEFVGRIQSRPLDRSRPLWEVYVVEGLEEDRFAVVTKTHQAMVDGVHAADIAQLLLDNTPAVGPLLPYHVNPRREPTTPELLLQAAAEVVVRPSRMMDVVREGVEEVAGAGGQVLQAMGGVIAALARTATRPAPQSPLNVRVGAPRRFCMVDTGFADYRKVREEFSDDPTIPEAVDVSIQDVVLATVTGALRTWLQTRGEAIYSSSTVRAMVPLSIYHEGDTRASGNRVIACFVDLPVGEPSAGLRLEQVSFQMRQQNRGAVGAIAIAELAGFAPPTLHHLGARMSSAVSRKIFNIVVTYVPGPQEPRYLVGARMLRSYPVIPLALGQAVAVGVTSYDGSMCVGINGDRAAMFDLDLLGDCVPEALAELVSTQPGERRSR